MAAAGASAGAAAGAAAGSAAGSAALNRHIVQEAAAPAAVCAAKRPHEHQARELPCDVDVSLSQPMPAGRAAFNRALIEP